MSSHKNSKESFDSLAKLAIIGDSSVGKTNILLRYINQEYQMSHIVTIGIDFKVKTVSLQNNYKLKLQIWDTAGQQRFRNLSGTIYQGASGIILAYSITSRKSFDNIKVWIEDIQNKVKQPSFILCIIGNKCDLENQRQVSKQQGLQMAKKFGAKIFMETSAKENINIEQLFYRTADKIRQNIQKSNPAILAKKPQNKGQVVKSRSKTMSQSSKIEKNSVNQSKVKLQAKKEKKKKCC